MGIFACLAKLAGDAALIIFVYVEGDIATTKSPEVNLGKNFASSNFPISFLLINLHTDTSKSIMFPSLSLTDTDTQNWKAAWLDAINLGWVGRLTLLMTL